MRGLSLNLGVRASVNGGGGRQRGPEAMPGRDIFFREILNSEMKRILRINAIKLSKSWPKNLLRSRYRRNNWPLYWSKTQNNNSFSSCWSRREDSSYK